MLTLQTMAAVFLALATLAAGAEMKSSRLHNFGGHLFVANRGSGSVSSIDPTTGYVRNFSLPAGAEPMYVSFYSRKGELWVGDRATNAQLIYNARGDDLIFDAALPTCPTGLFHSLITQDQTTDYPNMWTTCDAAGITVVQDVESRKTLALIKTPTAVARLGGFPHDATSNAGFGFVSYLGASTGAGYVGIYDIQSSFKRRRLIKTLDDPHVAVRDSSKLVVAAQGGEVLLVRPSPPFRIVFREAASSPHGIRINEEASRAYITNIADGGTNAIITLNMKTDGPLECPEVTTSFPGPHNPVVTLDGKAIYTSHSASSVVTVFRLRSDGCVRPRSQQVSYTGMVPFGVGVWPMPVPESDRGFSCLP